MAMACAGCGPGETTPPTPSTHAAELVVGLTSLLRPGVDVEYVDYEVFVGDEREAGKLPQSGALTFPLELPALAGEDGDEVRVNVAAMVGSRGFAIARRKARTTLRGRAKLLLPLRLDPSCGESASGPLTACDSSEGGPELTCDRGKCVDEYVPSTALAAYDSAWAKPSGDVCKRDGDMPTVVVGEGQGDYLSLTEGETVQVEAGPQGGHHIWIALRVKGLTQAGSITTLSGVVPSTSHTIEDFRVVFSLDPDDGGYCKLYGLRFQLDSSVPITELLGREIVVRASMQDADGAIGTGEKRVKLSDDVI